MVHCGPWGLEEGQDISGRKTRSREWDVKINNSMPVGLSESQIGPFHSLLKEFQIICLNRWIFFSLHLKLSLIIIAK